MEKDTLSSDPVVGKWDLKMVNDILMTEGYIQYENNGKFSLCLGNNDTPFLGTWEYRGYHSEERLYYAYINGTKVGLFSLRENSPGKFTSAFVGIGKLDGTTFIFAK